jgi:hypothetical protein
MSSKPEKAVAIKIGNESACDYRKSDRVQTAIVVGLRANRKIAPILEIHRSVRGQGGTNRGQRTSR